VSSTAPSEGLYRPEPAFSRQAHIESMEQYQKLYRQSMEDPEGFWAEIAAGELEWAEPWERVLEWDAPFARWFVGGRLSVAENCLDRHLRAGRGAKIAYIWEGEPGEVRTLTYRELHEEVGRFANALRGLGVRQGDRVAIYLPMIPELPIAMLACASIGAIHSVIFGGFSPEALRDRMNDAGAKVLVTADGGYRRGKVVPLKLNADEALSEAPSVEACVVVRRTGEPTPFQRGRDHWWHELREEASPEHSPAAVEATDPLFILYTSGTTGKPKGVVHSTGGYLTMAHITTKWLFDLKDQDIYWCSADIGWVTGHTYIVYGPLSNGTTIFMYEGAPDWPARDRFWDIIERHRISIFYTAPTAIRAFMAWGDEEPAQHDLSSLRLIGTVGEPINPEVWRWYRHTIGSDRCPIVDTWWQTESGAAMISPLPGATPLKPGSCTLPFPGVDAEVVDGKGNPVPRGETGFLAIRRPWPGMLSTLYKDPGKYKEAYWSQIPGMYFSGDGARRDEDGYFWILGRVDDVINVSGHRLGTAEVESALVSHPAVAEAAVVGFPHPLKGEGIFAFVTLTKSNGRSPSDKLANELREHVGRQIGAIARPDEIRFTDFLPKTRSGKIMRRLLREIASGSSTRGDTTTLEDVSVLEKLRAA
jgi:acetyl-CoA synthetase